MKEKLKNFGWSGWAAVGLGVALAVAMVVMSVRTPREEVAVGGDTPVVDASDGEVLDVSTPVVEGDDEVIEGAAGGTPEALPRGGAVGVVEFEYNYEW